jgi:hypothetical protein
MQLDIRHGFGVWLSGKYTSLSRRGTDWKRLLSPELYAKLLDE